MGGGILYQRSALCRIQRGRCGAMLLDISTDLQMGNRAQRRTAFMIFRCEIEPLGGRDLGDTMPIDRWNTPAWPLSRCVDDGKAEYTCQCGGTAQRLDNVAMADHAHGLCQYALGYKGISPLDTEGRYGHRRRYA